MPTPHDQVAADGVVECLRLGRAPFLELVRRCPEISALLATQVRAHVAFLKFPFIQLGAERWVAVSGDSLSRHSTGTAVDTQLTLNWHTQLTLN